MSRPDVPDAVAIIGLAGRFPHAASPAEFWRNLRAGREAVAFFADDQVQWLPFEHPPRRDDPRFVRARAILDRPEWFDAAFFGMNPREAALMDPQHRVFLECAWEALEDAGCNPETFPGLIGVFAGASMNTYLFSNLLTNRGLIENQGFFSTFLANDGDFVPTRVSYKLNLRGPSLNVQTACSTSLVAVCLAAQNLLGYRCDVALAGGVSITFPPHRGQHHVEGGIHSHDGHCRAFSAGATGTVLGDGAGIVVLKRLSDALADGDPIRAVIRGTAVNNDGAVKIGYTAPSSDGQAEAIALAHAEAGFAPETVSYIEAHGTGTPLGDPIEVEGLVKAFGLRGERGQFCGLGSVKTNIGHLDITAGVAGLIKTVLALEAQELPPSLHFDRPNPKIDFAASPFYVIDRLRPWPRGATPRRAGVSSFGIGGTNAHVALEEAPPAPASPPAAPHELLVLSARSPSALQQAAANLAAHLEAAPRANLGDVAWTLQTGRKAFPHRRAVVASDAAEAVRRLREPGAAVEAAERAPTVVFLFPGQGAQSPEMARGLYETEPAFREAVDECCRLLHPHLEFDLRAVLLAPAEDAPAARRLDETAVTQPALFVVEYALARLWLQRGLRAQALLGHSLGEYVAACLAGVFSLEDAVAVVAARARLMQGQTPGAMLAVRVPEAEARELAGAGIALAAVNAPDLCVLSGPLDAVAALEQRLTARGTATRRLATSHAFHSPAMEPVRAPLLAVLRRVRLQAPRLPIASNVTGRWLTAEEAMDPEYWTSQLRQPVRFADGLATVMQESPAVLLEVGPGQTLSTLARQHPATTGRATPVASLGRRGVEDARALREAAGRLWSAGVALQWTHWHAQPRRRVPLPTYPFERQRYWIEPGASAAGPLVTPPGSSATLAADRTSTATVAAAGPASPAALVPAETMTARLAQLFGELAGHDFRGENARRTFQELGLDSLALTQASFALRERFAVHVTMRQLLEEHSTLEKLAAHLGEAAAAPAPAAPAAAAPAGATTLPLTLGQREIWYVSQLGPALSAAYNESATLHLRGPLDEAALARALEALVARHEVLRLTIAPDGESQRLAVAAPAALGRTDLAGGPAEEQEARLEAEVDRIIGEPFDLVAGPLWRVHLIRLAPQRHALVAAFHHIICDGWSRSVLLQELGRLYGLARAGRPADLPPPASFAEFVRSEVVRRDSAETRAAEQFWRAQFPDGAPVLEIPSDRPRPAQRTHAASYRRRRLDPATAAAIRRLAAEHDATHFTVLLGGFSALLHRLSGQDDLVIGVPAAPQILAGLPGLAGHCVNLLPVRSRVGAGQDFAAYLQALRRTTLDAFEHWHHPFASLLRQLNLPRDPNRVPLANVTFNVGRQRGALAFAGLEVEASNNPKRFVNFDLSFNVTETDSALELDCHFSTELFDADTIQRHLDRFELLLRSAAADPACAVHRLPLLTPAEQRRVLVEWNRTAIAYPPDPCLHDLFERQAARTPDAVALVWGEERWTYRRLNERANQIAHRLRRLGVKPETPVGLLAGRTAATIAGVLGILKAGGAYIPLDPAYPAERTAVMLEDSRAAVVVTDGPRGGSGGASVLDLAAAAAELDREPVDDPLGVSLPAHLAYVIYTSGSTGRPKGVALEHRNAVNFVHWARDVFSPPELAGVLAATSLCFDLSVFEVFVPLSWGGTVILADNALHLPALPARDEVTLINTVPSAMTELLRLSAVPASVRTVNLAGEPVTPALVDRLYALPHLLKVHDLYGPTETTTYSTFALRHRGQPATIGRPLANTQVYLLDRNLELVPPGVPGEIGIAGAGVARGYLNQPVLTAQRFVPLPFDSAADARLYRTGDLARQRTDGQLEFIGRIDHQVKIRGFRIELGEIESALRRQPGVRDCVVVVTEPSPGDRALAAYVGGTARASDEPAFRAALARQLPDYMVPATLVFLERLPLTPTGKVDRKALPAPEASAAPRRAGGTAPRTVTEEVLAGIWSDVLRQPRVGVHDNFFELGGHSLLVTQALARIHQAFGVELPLRTAFESPTIAELAAAIEHALVEDLRSNPVEPASAHAAS